MLPNVQRTQTLYHAFGLHCRSELELPELLPSQEKEAEPDVEVVFGDLAQAWEDSGPHTSYFVVSGNAILFAVPGVAIYRIRDGREIMISPFAGADERVIRLYLLGSCMGALLMQRNILPLHGSAVVVDGEAYAFVGESGAGKSTLAAVFANRGFALLSDDVIALKFERRENGVSVPCVTPSYPQQKLWQESLDQLGLGSGYSPLYFETTKFAVPLTASYCEEKVPLKGIFELLPMDTAGSIEVEPLSPLERLPLIGQHTYRNFLIPQLGLQDWHFSQSAALAGITKVYRIRRPVAPFSAYGLADRVLQTIREGV